MSEIMVNVLGTDGAVHRRMHGADGERLVAALAADPESIAELELAWGRFVAPQSRHTPQQGTPQPGGPWEDVFEEPDGDWDGDDNHDSEDDSHSDDSHSDDGHSDDGDTAWNDDGGGETDERSAGSAGDFAWLPGHCDEPWDAGILYIDLVGRVVAAESSYSTLSRQGEVWCDQGGSAGIRLPYQLADDWLLLENVGAFTFHSEQRRERRLARPPRDERSVIFGRCVEFLAKAVMERRARIYGADEPTQREMAREIHAAWLLTPRDDLGGAAPRDCLIDDRHEHICSDLSCQQMRWTRLNAAPPGIPRDCMAYRFGGFGTNEIVLYYDLVRLLITDCVGRAARRPLEATQLPDEIDRLGRLMQDWLHRPQPDELLGRTPASVMDRERRRMPEFVTGEAAMIDCDCPLCQMMADESFGPTFWGLDGAHMDEDFAFSFYRDEEDWEREQLEWEQRRVEWENEERRRSELRDARGDFGPLISPLMGGEFGTSDIWRSSFSNPRATAELAPEQAAPLLLFGIGAHLAELCEDLAADAARARGLREEFMKLRQVIEVGNDWLLRSTAAGFRAAVEDVAAAHPKLAAKSHDLARQIDEFAQRCGGDDDTTVA